MTSINITRRRFATSIVAASLFTSRALADSVPQRIVSTAPSSTEALFALGLGPRVVGVSVFCEYPSEVKALPRVGTYMKPDLEAIVRLRPDLVALQRHPGPLTERLSTLGIRFVEMPYGTLNDVYTGIDLLARAAAIPDRGLALSRSIQAHLNAVRTQADASAKVRVCVIADRRAGLLADLIAVGPGNYVNDLIEIAGGVNVLNEAGLPMYPHISLETLLRHDPQVIIDLTDAHALDAAHLRVREQDLALWQQQQSLTAVRAHRVFLGDNSVLLVPGPRTPDAAEQFFHFFHQAHA